MKTLGHLALESGYQFTKFKPHQLCVLCKSAMQDFQTHIEEHYFEKFKLVMEQFIVKYFHKEVLKQDLPERYRERRRREVVEARKMLPGRSESAYPRARFEPNVQLVENLVDRLVYCINIRHDWLTEEVISEFDDLVSFLLSPQKLSRSNYRSRDGLEAPVAAWATAMESFICVFPGKSQMLRTKFYDQSIDVVLRSLIQGCHLCWLLWADFDPSPLERCLPLLNDRGPARRLSQLFLSVQHSINMDFRGYITQSATTEVIQQLEVGGSITKSLIRGPVETSIKDTDAPSPMEVARTWLKECVEQHQPCRNAYESVERIPSRLLFVGRPGPVRLILTSRIKADDYPRYVTLSHCWGSSQPLRLLAGNQTEFETEIPSDIIPRTFLDAIFITQNLGFKYLWIDSLCIVQDMPLDWELESAIMGEIYRGSIFTIAACEAEDCQAGIFPSKSLLATVPCRLFSNEENLFIQGPLWNTQNLFAESKPSPERMDRLSSRGWAFQEEAMSPRTLIFEKNGFRWDCAVFNVDHESETNRFRPKLSLRNTLSSGVLLANKRGDFGAWSGFGVCWANIVETYTAKSLTLFSDKLVAIHGIITKIHLETDLTPLAGLWKELMPSQLLWHGGHSNKHYRAPSWSWAAVDGRVSYSWLTNKGKIAKDWIELKRMYPAVQMEWVAELLAGELIERPNGQVTGGYLLMSGPILSIKKTRIDQFRRQCRVWELDDVNESCGIYWLLLIGRVHRENLSFAESKILNSGRDLGLVLGQVSEAEDKFCRRGYFEHHYWLEQEQCIFQGNLDQYRQTIKLI